MRFLSHLSFIARVNLYVMTFVVVIATALGGFLYVTQRNHITNLADQVLSQRATSLDQALNHNASQRKALLGNTIKYISFIFKESGGFAIQDSALYRLLVTDEVTKVQDSVMLPTWTMNGVPLYGNEDFVEFAGEQDSYFVTIFQKHASGYVSVASNVFDEDGNKTTNRVIPKEKNMIQTVETGRRHTAKEMVVNDWAYTIYDPIYQGDEVVGMVFVGIRQTDRESLAREFELEMDYPSAYTFLLDEDGIFLLNLGNAEREGKDISDQSFYFQIEEAHRNGHRYFSFMDPPGAFGREFLAFFTYNSEYGAYSGVIVPETEAYQGLAGLGQRVVVSLLVAVLLIFAVLFLSLRPIGGSLLLIMANIRKMATGEWVEPLPKAQNDELGEISEALNRLGDAWQRTARFASSIEKGEFELEFSPMGQADLLGNALIDMRLSLQQAKLVEEKRQREDEQRRWASDGLAMFNDIFRRSSGDIRRLAHDIIAELVRYVGAAQGGIFLYRTEDPQDLHLEMLASFAYDRAKFRQKRIEHGEGLLGVAAIEKAFVHLDEVPEEYLEVRSGLGHAEPHSLVIAPLLFEDEVLGVLEMASLKAFEPHQIDFVRKLSDNIGATFASAKINLRTSELLDESRRRSREMQEQEEEMRQNFEALQDAKRLIDERDEEQKRQIDELTRQNEAKLQEIRTKELESKAIINALDTTTILIEYDFDGNIIFANRFALDKFGMSLEQLVGHHHSEFLGDGVDSSSDAYRKFWQELKRGNTKNEISRIWVAGREIWLSETYTPVFDDNSNPYKVLKISYDITDDKRREDELHEKMKMLQDLRESNQKAMDKILDKADRRENRMRRKLAETQEELDAILKRLEQYEGPVERKSKEQDPD